MKPIISIIIPAFNREGLVSRTLDSVLAQTYLNWECIVIDDGSFDGTQEVINKFIQDDDRFVFLKRNREPKGAPTCRNIGLDHSKGVFVMFLDCDDILEAKCLQERVELFNKKQNIKADCLVFNTARREANGEIFSMPLVEGNDFISLFLEHRIPWTIMGPIWRRNSLSKINGFDESFVRLQDVEFHLRALLKGLVIKDCRREPPNVIYQMDASKYLDSIFLKKHLRAEGQFIVTFSKKLPLKYRKVFAKRIRRTIVNRAVFIGKLYKEASKLCIVAYEHQLISKWDKLLLSVFIKSASIGFLKIRGIGTLWSIIIRTL